MKTKKLTRQKARKPARNGTALNRNGDRLHSGPAHNEALVPRSAFEAVAHRYIELYDFAPIPYVSFDHGGQIEEANLAASNLLGKSRKNLMGSVFATYVAQNESQKFLQHLLFCRTRRECVETDLTLKNKSGEAIPVHLTSMPTSSFASNGAVLYQTVIFDLRERKRAERALVESEAKFRAIVDQTTAGIARCDFRGRLGFVNHNFCEMLGYEEPELIGKTIGEITHPDDIEKTMRLFRRMVRTGKSFEVEKRYLRKDGSILWTNVSASPIHDAAGKPQSAVAIVLDISERKRAEEELVALKDRVSAELTAMTRLHAFSTRLLATSELQPLLEEILDATIKIQGADFGNIQLYDPNTGKLKIVAQRGFKKEFIDYFNNVRDGKAAYARAVERRQRVIIEDVALDAKFKPQLRIAANAGIRAVHSTPLLDRSGAILGVLSTHFRQPHRPSAYDLRLTDLYAIQASDMIAFKITEAKLRRSERELEQRVEHRTAELLAANKELKNEIRRRKGLEGEILEISDREQQRLAWELHDGLCQHLTGVAFMARAMAARLRDHRVFNVDDLEKIAELVNQGANDARKLARGLHAADVDSAGLMTALRDLVSRQIWNTPCRLEVKNEPVIHDDTVASHLYRLVREAVINANKHARAKEIVVKITRSRNQIIVSVSDNGGGIPAGTSNSEGLGFHIMKYRARSIGARLEIKPGPRGGTRVACYLPQRK